MSAFIDEHRGRFGVEPICETLGVSASAYYQRATGERSARTVEDERLLGVIEELARGELLRLRLTPDVEGTAKIRGAGRPQPCGTVDAPERHSGRQAAREAVADY